MAPDAERVVLPPWQIETAGLMVMTGLGLTVTFTVDDPAQPFKSVVDTV